MFMRSYIHVLCLLLSLGAGCATPYTSTFEAIRPRTSSRLQIGQKDSSLPVPKTSASLEHLLDYATSHHPTLQADHARWKAQTALSGAVGRWANPMVSYTFAPLPIETRLGPNRHPIALSQRVPWLSRSSIAQSVATSRAQALAHEYDARYLTTRLDVEQLYWTLYAIDQEQEVLERELILLETLEAGLMARVETGTKPASELARVGLLKSKLSDRVSALDAIRAAQETRLGQALGLSTPHPVEFSPLSDISTPVMDLEAFDVMLDDVPTPPMLRALEESIESQRRRQELVELDRMPDFEVGAQWALIGEGEAMAAQRGRDAVMLRVGISVPLWESATAAKVDAAEATTLQAEATLQAARHEWLASSRQAHIQVLDTARRIQVIQDTLLVQARATFRCRSEEARGVRHPSHTGGESCTGGQQRRGRKDARDQSGGVCRTRRGSDRGAR